MAPAPPSSRPTSLWCWIMNHTSPTAANPATYISHSKRMPATGLARRAETMATPIPDSDLRVAAAVQDAATGPFGLGPMACFIAAGVLIVGLGGTPDDGVALGHVQRNPLFAVFIPAAGADCDDGAFLRLLLGGVGNDQTGSGRGLGLVGLNEDLVLEWLDVHARHDGALQWFG